MFAIIPTVVLAGPTALLAFLFPAIFAALAVFWRRWWVLFSAVSLCGVLFLAHAWFRGPLIRSWWGTPNAVWTGMAIVSGIGAVMARLRRREPSEAAIRFASGCLGLLALASLAVMWFLLAHGVFWRAPWYGIFPLSALAIAGTILLLRDHWLGRSTPMPETGMLLSFGTAWMTLSFIAVPPSAVEVCWLFEAADRGLVFSTPALDDQHVYVSVAHKHGAIHAIDRATGKLAWTFHRARRMKQTMSSPVVDRGRLYVGEGLHEDDACGLYCIDATSGQELWRFATGSHVESSPSLVDGCVVFGAGDDGVYCANALTGELHWRFPGVHVDATPTVSAGRIYAGSAGPAAELFCLDARTGKSIWRVRNDLTLFAAPALTDDAAYFGIGNGKLDRPAAQPAGAVLCLDATSGAQRWRFDVADAVLGSPVVMAGALYFGSRDGYFYCLNRSDGSLRWKQSLGSPVGASPVVADGWLYVVARDGLIRCLDPHVGSTRWRFDIGRHARARPEMLSSPRIVGSRLYVAGGLHNSIHAAAVVYCLQVP